MLSLDIYDTYDMLERWNTPQIDLTSQRHEDVSKISSQLDQILSPAPEQPNAKTSTDPAGQKSAIDEQPAEQSSLNMHKLRPQPVSHDPLSEIQNEAQQDELSELTNQIVSSGSCDQAASDVTLLDGSTSDMSVKSVSKDSGLVDSGLASLQPSVTSTPLKQNTDVQPSTSTKRLSHVRSMSDYGVPHQQVK